MKVCICAIAKNENNYIREWVEWHKNIGISKIFLYDNNDMDGERFEDVINDYIESNFVEVISLLRGVSTGNRQSNAYIDCYKNKCLDYDWCAFIDIDEFINTNGEDISAILSDNIYLKYNAIRLYYKMYKDDNIITINNCYNVKKRFKSFYISNYGKSIIKTNLNINFIAPHGSREAEPSCDELGNYVTYLSDCSKISNNIPTFNKMWIDHYSFKSLEEYINKMNRGYPNFPKGENPPYLSLKWFFSINGKTPEKLAYLKSIGIDYE